MENTDPARDPFSFSPLFLFDPFHFVFLQGPVRRGYGFGEKNYPVGETSRPKRSLSAPFTLTGTVHLPDLSQTQRRSASEWVSKA